MPYKNSSKRRSSGRSKRVQRARFSGKRGKRTSGKGSGNNARSGQTVRIVVEHRNASTPVGVELIGKKPTPAPRKPMF